MQDRVRGVRQSPLSVIRALLFFTLSISQLAILPCLYANQASKEKSRFGVGACGDGVCDAKEQANPALCPQDCRKAEKPACGNGLCENKEGCSSCPDDCGNCPVTEDQTHFGVQGALPKFADELRESGVEIIRVWIWWDKIEPQKGRYNWSEMDEIVRKANDRNIEVLGYFAFMPAWAKNTQNPKCRGAGRKGIPVDPCEPADWDDFTRFARDVAQRYDGRHGYGRMKYIEIWNEVQGFGEMSSGEYGPWLVKGYQAVKQGNPDALVLIGAVHSPLDFNGGNSGQATGEFIDAALKDYGRYYDIFNFHIYQRKDEALGRALDYMKLRMQAYNVKKPIWITETATFWSNVLCDNLQWQHEAAKGVVKRYAQALGNGAEKVFWYAFSALPTIEEDSTGIKCKGPTNFLMGGLGWVFPKGRGLPIDEFHPRPAYYAYKLMTSKLAGFSSVEKITDTQYKFMVKGKPVYVLWCVAGGCLLPSEIEGAVKVTDYLGNEETRDAHQIRLTESPLFLEEISSK